MVNAADPVNLHVLATKLDHTQGALDEMKGTMQKVLERLTTLASVDEVKSIREEMASVRAENAALRAEVAAERTDRRALENRVRTLEDARTAAKAIIALAGLIGLGTVGAFVRWLALTP